MSVDSVSIPLEGTENLSKHSCKNSSLSKSSSIPFSGLLAMRQNSINKQPSSHPVLQTWKEFLPTISGREDFQTGPFKLTQ